VKGFALARHIIAEVCEEYGIPYKTMISSHIRSHTVVLARREAILKVKAATTLNFSEIGKVFGFADHTGVRKIILASKIGEACRSRKRRTSASPLSCHQLAPAAVLFPCLG